MARTAEVIRNTKETRIRVELNLDGVGNAQIHTGIGFFDHMLDGFARHGLFDLTVEVDGLRFKSCVRRSFLVSSVN